MMTDLYPITIIKDRYNGVYSGGKWTAWNCRPWRVPEDIFEDDVSCMEYWNKSEHYDDPFCGVGETIEDAIEDLQRNIEKFNEIKMGG